VVAKSKNPVVKKAVEKKEEDIDEITDGQFLAEMMKMQTKIVRYVKS
jgi:hypothetical protein